MPASFTRGLPIDDYVAIASFLYFGIKSLLDAREIGISGEDNAGIAEERQDAEDTLKSGGSELKGGWPLVIEEGLEPPPPPSPPPPPPPTTHYPPPTTSHSTLPHSLLTR